MAIVDRAAGGRAVAGEAAASASCADLADEAGPEGGTAASPVPSMDHAGRSALTRPCRDEPDGRLVELCRAGHGDAFDEIVERYQGLLLRHCQQIVGSAGAQDAVQDALLAAWSSIRAGADIQTLRSWLLTIAHRKALTSLRDQRRRPLELSESLSRGGSSADEATRAAHARETLAALAQLPDSQRDALLGTAVHGRSGGQIARDLGVEESTVRQLVFRARATLRTTAAACLLPPVFLIRLLRRVAGSPTRLAALARSALRPNQAEMTARVVKGSALAIVGLTIAGAGGAHLIGSQHRAPPMTNRPRVPDPARRGQRLSASFAATRSPAPVARPPVRPAHREAAQKPLGVSRRRLAPAGVAAPATRSRRLSVAAPDGQVLPAPPTAPAVPGDAAIPTPSSLATIVTSAPTQGGPVTRTVTRALTPAIPPSVTPTAQNATPASTTTTQAVQAAGQATGSAVQILPANGLPAAPTVTLPAPNPAPAGVGIAPTGP